MERINYLAPRKHFEHESAEEGLTLQRIMFPPRYARGSGWQSHQPPGSHDGGGTPTNPLCQEAGGKGSELRNFPSVKGGKIVKERGREGGRERWRGRKGGRKGKETRKEEGFTHIFQPLHTGELEGRAELSHKDIIMAQKAFSLRYFPRSSKHRGAVSTDPFHNK